MDKSLRSIKVLWKGGGEIFGFCAQLLPPDKQYVLAISSSFCEKTNKQTKKRMDVCQYSEYVKIKFKIMWPAKLRYMV